MNKHKLHKRTALLLVLCYLIAIFFSLFVAVHVTQHHDEHADCSICNAIHTVTVQIQNGLTPAANWIQFGIILLLSFLGTLFMLPQLCASTLVSERVRLDR